MSKELVTLTQNAIDSAIRGFEPAEAQSYLHWDTELEKVEDLLLSATRDFETQMLLASVRTQRIRLAAETGRTESVLEQSYRFLRDSPADAPSFSAVIVWRLRALHDVGAHNDELREGLAVARDSRIQGSEYIFLLEGLSKRHPGSLAADSQLSEKLRHAVAQLGEVYSTLSFVGGKGLELEDAIREVARDLRIISRAKSEGLIADRNS